MPIANEFDYDINTGSFGRFGSHTPYEPSAINQVGNQGQWWTEPPALEAQQSQQAEAARVGQQLSNPAGSFDEYIHSFGGSQVPVRQNVSIFQQPENRTGRMATEYVDYGSGPDYRFTNPSFSFGQQVPGLANSGFARDKSRFARQGYTQDLTDHNTEFQYAPAYVNKSGGFLGYEEDMQRRYQDQLINSMRNVQGV